MVRLTEDKHLLSEAFLCTNVQVYELHHYVFLSAFNISLSFAAFLGNVLILIALYKESSLHSPSKLIFRCLAITDICVGLISQPAFAAELLFELSGLPHLCYYFGLLGNVTSVVFSGVSLLTVTAISVDRFLAVSLGLRYRPVVTVRRVSVIVSCFWVVGVAVSLMQRFWSPIILSVVMSTIIVLCLVTSAICYIKIFLFLRHHQHQIHPHDHQGQPNDTGGTALSTARYRKTLSTALWVQIIFIICYLPQGLINPFAWLFSVSHISHFLNARYTTSLVYLNSSVNPIIFCWKIQEARQAAKDTIRKLCCLSN